MKKTYLLLVLAILICSSFILVDAQNTTNTTQNNVTQPPAPRCDAGKCESSCVKCADRQCHPQGFVCIEDVNIEKFFPDTITTGVTQLNIVLRNVGTVNLDDVYVLVTGDGIETIDKIPLQKFIAGDKDYVFAKINATKPGTIDVVMKLYVSGNLKNRFVEQLVVKEPVMIPKNVTVLNVTLITSSLEQARQAYKLIEQDYQNKKTQGYSVDIIYDKLRQTSAFITDAQTSLLEGDYKKAQATIAVIQSNINDIKDQLNSAQLPTESLSDQIKNNLLFFGSLAAAIVSIFTAYKLVQGSVDHKKLLEKLKKSKSSKTKKTIRKKLSKERVDRQKIRAEEEKDD